MKHLGLARGMVDLVPHQKSWHGVFRREAEMLTRKLGRVEDIQHVGSTAIHGVPAKPIVDIAIPVFALTFVAKWKKPLQEIGYEYRGAQGVRGRRLFVKGPPGNRTLYLHIVNKEEFGRLIAFRDTLKNDKGLAALYSKLKRRLAKQFAHDRRSYTRGKQQFIRKVLNGKAL